MTLSCQWSSRPTDEAWGEITPSAGRLLSAGPCGVEQRTVPTQSLLSQPWLQAWGYMWQFACSFFLGGRMFILCMCVH